eukprot:TRINITY_DN26239_c0_g1_i1.p1 TRINITY_DN26239_c0_g1~~TRINITY_DN26239_c0_g1_i1.p1  ORF type:complete len:212 (+),score=5.14 TRINITY_DN26239_c0_g1_i1:118-753(+)
MSGSAPSASDSSPGDRRRYLEVSEPRQVFEQIMSRGNSRPHRPHRFMSPPRPAVFTDGTGGAARAWDFDSWELFLESASNDFRRRRRVPSLLAPPPWVTFQEVISVNEGRYEREVTERVMSRVKREEFKEKESTECAICLEDLKAKDEVGRLPCQHVFHVDCITPWLKSHVMCPVCRLDLSDGDGQRQRQRPLQPPPQALLLPPTWLTGHH